MKEDIYSELCKHMNEAVVGAPETKEFLEILRLRFTPEEAELALILPFIPEELSKIAQSANKEKEELRSKLEQMADRGLVYKQTISEKGKTQELYSLFPTLMGIWETSFAKGEINPRTEQLARLWREYYDTGWGKEMHRTKTPLTRIIPVEKSITSQLEILPHERASELIKGEDIFAVIHCACRSAAKLEGKGCGNPTEVCLHWGDMATYMAERGYGRKIDRKEALDILDRTEEAGMVHLTINTQEGCFVICSCCSCCCTQLRAISELPKPGAVAKSRFMPVVDLEECTACGICEERCQVGAIAVIDELGQVNRERCIGCGLCVTACPDEAISLKEKEMYEAPIPTIEKLAETVIREKAQ